MAIGNWRGRNYEERENKIVFRSAILDDEFYDIENAQSKTVNDGWEDESAFKGLLAISFEQQSELFKPIFKLPKLLGPNAQSVDAIIKAVEQVLANASRRNSQMFFLPNFTQMLLDFNL